MCVFGYGLRGGRKRGRVAGPPPGRGGGGVGGVGGRGRGVWGAATVPAHKIVGSTTLSWVVVTLGMGYQEGLVYRASTGLAGEQVYVPRTALDNPSI